MKTREKTITLEELAETDKPLMARLLQLYLYDLSVVLGFPVGPDGCFEYDYLDRFWQHPYVFRHAGEIIGFAMVVRGCVLTGHAECWFLAEFCILRGHRRKGLGRQAFEAVRARHPGPWHVGALRDNAPAIAFWSRVLGPLGAAYEPIHHDGTEWRLARLA